MNERSIQHATFVIERIYGASSARVFAAWADPETKAQWFPKADEFAFQVGGRECNHGTHGGATYTFDAHYQDIVPDQRIAYTYVMDRDETRISVSVVTVEFQKSSTGTRLIYTEQGAFFDGEDKPEYREQGTKGLLDSLDAMLQRERMPEENKH